MSIKCYNGNKVYNEYYLFGLRLRFESHQPEHVVDQMKFNMKICLATVPLTLYLEQQECERDKLGNMIKGNGTETTYRSTLASSSSSSFFSDVGCQLGIS